MIFIETANKRGDRIAITEIVKVWDEPDQDRRTTFPIAELRDGQTVQLQFGLSAELVARAACQVLPAQPGFELLVADFSEEEEVWHRRQPVIGWRIEPCGVEPVVADDPGDSDSTKRIAIRYPDGQVIDRFDRDYKDEDEWRAEMEIKHKFNQRNAEKSRKPTAVVS